MSISRGIATVVSAAALAIGTALTAAPASAALLGSCSVGTLSDGDQCTLAPGESIYLVLKGGNGGAGGAGGDGGNGGAGWDGSATVVGGAGGAGGSGGAGGAGAKWQGSYTNSTASTVTLTFTIGASGANGAVGTAGANGADSTQSGAASDGGTGVSGNGGLGGAGGQDTYVQIGSTTIAIALGGDGGAGGQGGAGGEGGQGTTPAPGRAGPDGSSGTAGADGAGGNISCTDNREAPSISIVSSPVTCADPTGPEGPPVWMQAYEPETAEPCREGWSASWAQWGNGGLGGSVCNRYIVLRQGQWMQTPDPDFGPFAVWDRL